MVYCAPLGATCLWLNPVHPTAATIRMLRERREEPDLRGLRLDGYGFRWIRLNRRAG
ncbi:MAG: hypothetical protein QOF44_5239 [Streptomyces sp.]|nr:hypothetical protein [Streptomyces sp.]